MATTTRLTLALVVATTLATAGVSAEDRATVFVHGLNSNSSTWDHAVSSLAPPLAIEPITASLRWQEFYEVQAAELEQKVGGRAPANTIAVGHSNGGIVSRQWSRNRDIGGLVTLGSPNQGAPVIDHLYDYLYFLDDLLDRMLDVSAVFAQEVDPELWWWLPGQWAPHFNVAFDIWRAAENGLALLGLQYPLAIVSEMGFRSSYMGNLNSRASLDREAARVPSRIAIVSIARDFIRGGPFRTSKPDTYEQWALGVDVAGITFEGLAGVIRVIADPYDLGAFHVADRLDRLGEWFLMFEDVWCMTVSDPSPYSLARCLVNDGIVPAWSQAYDASRVPFIVLQDGPIHTSETRESDGALYDALRSSGVQTRQSTELPPGGSIPPTLPPPTGRYKSDGVSCVWDPNDSGPDQCAPTAPPTGRFKFDGSNRCYWEPNDSPPDQCVPPPAGRYKADGAGGCYWDANDEGPNQCEP